MKARTRRMIPAPITPGLSMGQGHYRTGEKHSLFSNEKRLVNLHRPELVRLAPARHVSIAEWEAGR